MNNLEKIREMITGVKNSLAALKVDPGKLEKEAQVLSQQYNIVAMVLFCSSRFVCTLLLKYVNPGALLMVLAGATWGGGRTGFWARPLRHYGSGGALVIAFVLSFHDSWRVVANPRFLRTPEGADQLWAMPDSTMGILIPLAAIALLVFTVRRKDWYGFAFGLMPILAILGYSLSGFTTSTLPAAVLFNLYLFACGIWMLVTGIRMDKQQAKDWIDAGLRSASFSLDGMSSKTHDSIRGVEGAYKRTIRAIHILRRDRPFEELNIDFDELERRRKAEYDKLDRMQRFARTRRCRQLEILDPAVLVTLGRFSLQTFMPGDRIGRVHDAAGCYVRR